MTSNDKHGDVVVNVWSVTYADSSQTSVSSSFRRIPGRYTRGGFFDFFFGFDFDAAVTAVTAVTGVESSSSSEDISSSAGEESSESSAAESSSGTSPEMSSSIGEGGSSEGSIFSTGGNSTRQVKSDVKSSRGSAAVEHVEKILEYLPPAKTWTGEH